MSTPFVNDDFTPGPGILRYLRENRERIEGNIGLRITQPIDAPYGCGSYGCVWALSDPKWVLKISDDPSEGPLVKMIVDIRAQEGGGDGFGPSKVLPGIVWFRSLYADDAPPDNENPIVWVIVRENLQPFEGKDAAALPWYFAHRWTDSKHGNSALNIARAYAGDFFEGNKPDESLDQFIYWMSKAGEDTPLVAQTVFDLAARTPPILLRDVHDRNIGYTLRSWGRGYRPKGSVVIHDLGVTPTGRVEIQHLNPTSLSPDELARLTERASIR
jgi:hypothetical protein